MTRSSSSLNSYIAVITVTSAQILNLIGNPVTLIPAPAVDSFIYVNKMIATLNYNTTAYTAGDSLFDVSYDSISNSTQFDSLLLKSEDTIKSNSDFSSISESNSASDFLNKSIIVSNTQADNFTNGDSDVTFTFYYDIIKTNL